MTTHQYRRVLFVVFGLAVGTLLVIYRLISFQFLRDEDLITLAETIQVQQVIAQPERGIIYDRNMAVLAGNGSDYLVGVSPTLVSDPEEMASALAPILEEPRHELLFKLTSDSPYELLSSRISAAVADELLAGDFEGLQLDALPRRIYPQGELLCHELGYTDFNNIGGAGLEGYYQAELAGQKAVERMNISPLTSQASVIAREGTDLVLTIDRTVQYTAERHLANALKEYQADSGTIIVMDPRTGAILAMANLPCYSPQEFYDVTQPEFLNPAVSLQFEPGSVMKVITMAAALDSGTVTPSTTYHDAGVLVVGGHPVYNWDRSARGTVDMTGLLANSLNVGAATIATWMGQDTFYHYLQRFGFGRPTGVDLMAEASGALPLPGDENWTETNIATNAFGQGLAVTPLQMITAVAALANGGYLMQPYLVQERHADGRVQVTQPTIVGRPISQETANQVTAMAVNAVRTEIFGAQIEHYTLAGKTGTAQIPEGGIYHPTDTIGSFIGWLPADAPEVIVLVKLDRPGASPWGSMTAAPTFSALAQELLGLLNIPPDSVRLQGDVLAVRSN
jgi:cell division protein FtsI/penicillin-binding protein 2